jgi:RNA polymerase sigma factor (sigma-70 family)
LQVKNSTRDQTRDSTALSPAEWDRRLVDRCLAANPDAWTELYQRYHRGLTAAVDLMFASCQLDADVIEEIVARVWYAVVANGAELLDRFDPARNCRLSTYLATIARNEARGMFRSERRRRSRENIASRPNWEPECAAELYTQAEIEEFLSTLSPREREFCAEVLLLGDEESEGRFSQSNAWKLRSRIRGKLRSYTE